MALSSIGEVIKKRAARYVSLDAAVLISVGEVWKKIKDTTGLEKAIVPSAFKKGTLRLTVSSLAEAAHIRLQKERIKKEINSFLKKEFIKDIKFEVKKKR